MSRRLKTPHEIRNFFPLVVRVNSNPPPAKKSNRGRKPRPRMATLQTRFWCGVVFFYAGVDSAYALEKILYPNKWSYVDGKTKRPEKWDAYVDGAHSPTARNGDDPVALAEAHFPGSAAVYRSVLWSALAERGWTPERATEALLTLSSSVTAITLKRPRSASDDNPANPRIPTFDEAAMRSLVAEGSLDALAALVVFVRLSEGISSVELRELALRGLSLLSNGIPADSPLTPHYEALFREIDLCCKHWVYADAAQRTDIVIFGPGWKNYTPVDSRFVFPTEIAREEGGEQCE